MIRLPGEFSTDLCDPQQKMTRRDVLRVGGSGILGLTLGTMLQIQGQAGGYHGGPGFGRARSVIMLYLQGGPSHLDLWDPKENVPDNVRSVFSPASPPVSRAPGSPRSCPSWPGSTTG